MKYTILILLSFTIVAAKAQEVKVKIDTTGNTRFQLTEQKPLFILDGLQLLSFDSMNPNKIEMIEVIKGKKALELYGEKGKNGVVVITSKDAKWIIQEPVNKQIVD